MARYRRSAITPAERRMWLEQLEGGRGITEISRKAGRDIRIVKHHIEIATEERQIGMAKRDFLVGRIEQHQQDLLAEVRRLQQVTKRYPPARIVPNDTIARKIHEGLKEHVRRLALKSLLESVEEATREFERTRESISTQLAQKETELATTMPQEVRRLPWTPAIVEVLETGQLRGESTGFEYSAEKRGSGLCDVNWGAYHLTRSPVSEDLVPTIIEIHKRLLSYSAEYVSLFQKERDRFSELKSQINEELDVFIIRRLVPGRCRYCPV